MTVTNQWQSFSNNVNADTFRITTNIQDLNDWNFWKFRSGAYLRFIYTDGSASISYYIKVRDVPTIYQWDVPSDLKQQNEIIRTPAIIRASKYLPLTPNHNFAQWSLKLEALQ